MKNLYLVAGHRFGVSGQTLCKAVECIEGFKPFRVEEGEVLFSFVEGTDVPQMHQVQYEFAYEDVTGTFGRTERGFMLTLKPQSEDAFHLCIIPTSRKCRCAETGPSGSIALPCG